jgi:hypothetical protein
MVIDRELQEAIRYAREVASWNPTKITRAPIGKYLLYEDRHIRVRISDQLTLEDFAIWTPDADGKDWVVALWWSPYEPRPDSPQIYRPGNWISYLAKLAPAKSRALLEWRAAHWTEPPSFRNRAAG